LWLALISAAICSQKRAGISTANSQIAIGAAGYHCKINSFDTSYSAICSSPPTATNWGVAVIKATKGCGKSSAFSLR
jgi:hypothetical protein